MMPDTTPFKYIPVLTVEALCLLIAMCAFSSSICAADLHAVTDDGRKVLLRDDGSWTFIQHDRPETGTGAIRVSLENAVIQTHTTRALKNSRVRTRMVFDFNLQQSANASSHLDAKTLDTSLVAVTDDTGVAYEVKSLQLAPAVVQPGETAHMVLKVDKSPGALSEAKYIDVVFLPPLFGNGQPIRFRTRIDDIETVEAGDF